MAEFIKFVGPFRIRLVVLSIGISLGGITGFAINNFRDI